MNVEFEMALVRYGQPDGTAAVIAYLDDIREKVADQGFRVKNPVEGRHGGFFYTFGDYSLNLFENIKFAEVDLPFPFKFPHVFPIHY